MVSASGSGVTGVGIIMFEVTKKGMRRGEASQRGWEMAEWITHRDCGCWNWRNLDWPEMVGIPVQLVSMGIGDVERLRLGSVPVSERRYGLGEVGER